MITKTSRGITLIATLTLIVAAAGCGAPGPDATDEPTAGFPTAPHPVIVVAIDGLRADRAPCVAESSVETPNLDAFAAESVCFSQAFTQHPTAVPALASLLTGAYPTTHSVDETGDALPPEAETVAEAAAASGVPTAAFVAGGVDARAAGLEQGFDTVETAPAPISAAVAWLEGHDDRPFLAMAVATTLAELDAGDDAEPTAVAESYDAQVAALDAVIGELRTALGTSGLDAAATVVLVGTSGYSLGEHGDAGQSSLYPEVVRVPLMVRLPGGAMAQTIDKTVELVDVAPTVAELLGLAAPAGMQATSLSALIQSAGTPPYIAFGESGDRRFVALAGYQMISGADGGNPELFHLAVDPLAADDIAAGEAGRVEVLQGHLEAWDAMVHAASLDPDKRTEELDDDTLEQLKSLGYIQ